MPITKVPIDYLAGRRNAVKGSHVELNGKLSAIADTFNPAWLMATPAASPVQRLWQRMDELATNELFNFGDAVARWVTEEATWLSGHVKLVKGRDRGKADGAIFEILALNLFNGTTCRVRPTPASKPGFDGTLELADGSRVLVSAKNHGMSSYEKGFLAAARRFDRCRAGAGVPLASAGALTVRCGAGRMTGLRLEDRAGPVGHGMSDSCQ